MIEINNLGKSSLQNKFLEKIAKVILKGEKSKLILSVVLVSKNKIKELNKRYRKKDRQTDVLSFIYSKQEGEIVLCTEIIRENAKKFNSTFNKELKRILIHGVLHLFGYSHEESKVKAKKMQEKENYYFNLCQKII